MGAADPKVKRLVAVSAIGVVILGAMALTTSPPEEKQRGRHESIKSILTDKNTCGTLASTQFLAPESAGK
jgi:conjugal transfer pilus assembly protein TraB